MRVFHLFLGLFLLISITVSQSVEAGSSIPAGLQSTIEHVKQMKRSGTSRKDIAAYVTRTVSNRVTFLNHNSKKLDSFMGDAEIAKNLKRFDAFWDKGNLASDEFSAAVWVWVNRIGQCNEGASTAFHILVMAYESTDEITTVTKGDHRFVILGDVKNIPDPFSADDLRKLDNTYIVDPWDGVSFSTKDLSFFDWFQHGKGNPVARSKYKFYKRKYNKWLTWCKKNPVEFQKWLHGLSDTAAEEKVEHKDSMNFTLAQYREEINALKELKKQILQKGKASLKKTKSNIREANFIQFELKKYEILILALVDQGKSYCDNARKLHQKIIALSAAIEDGEALVNAKVNLAKDRKANCKTDGDGVSIKNNYQAAQDAFAIMKTAKEAAFESLVDINIKLEQIKGIDNELSQHDSNWWKEQRGKHEEFLEAIPQYLDQLETGLEDAKRFPEKMQALKAKIEDSKKYYIQYFPGEKAEFDQLISEVSSIRLYYVIDLAGLSDLSQEYQTAQTALDNPTGNNPRLFKGAPPLINCFSNEASKKVMDKIDESFLRGLLVLKASDYLRDGCKVKVVVKYPPKDNDNSQFVDTGGSTPGISAVDPADKVGQGASSNSMGGLIIVGPAKIVAGQGVTYTACDGTGIPYTSGSFSWGISDESVMSLDKSGNPASGYGFKAGKVTIFAHYDGGDIYTGTAYLDVKIKKKENNLFSTSGGEGSETGQGDLFGTSGGETIAVDTTPPVTDINCDHIPGSTAVQGNCICTDGLILSPSRGRCISCDEYHQASKSAIADGALNAAQAIVNEAGECTSWTARVQGLINSARQNQICENISGNLQAACQANNAKNAHGFMAEANQNNCNIDAGLWQWGNTLIADYNQKIGEQRAAQKQQQQPQNQTSWMDMMNTIVKGMQQGSSKPSGGGSKPSSSSSKNNWPPFPTRTYNGMDPGVISSVPGAGAVNSSGNTSQSQNNNNHSGSQCRGHHIKCGDAWSSWGYVLDSNNDKICDECNLPYNPGREVYKSRKDYCRER